jgi:hypothetical protein
MMPSNTPPLENQKLQDAHDASENSTNIFERQNALMHQLLASRQHHQTRRYDTHLHQHESSQHPNDGGAMLQAGLNESMMGYAHQQPQQQDNLRPSQHDSLRHPQHDMQQHSYNDAGGSLQREQLSQHLSGMPQHHQQQQQHYNVQDNLTGSSSNMHHFSGGGNMQNNSNSFGQFGNGHNAMRQNANQAHQHHADDDLLSIMLMASRQANVPSVFNTMMNTNEQGEGSSSAVSEADMLRAYNQSLSQALLAATNQPPQQQPSQQQQHSYGGGHSSMPSSYQSANMNMGGHHQQRQSQATMGGHHPPAMYHHQPGQPGINRNTSQNRFCDLSTMPAQFPGDIPERIEPSAMGNATLGHGGMLDIPYGIQQQRLAELGVGGAKRPYDGSLHHHHHIQPHRAAPPKKKKRRSQRKKPADMPRRPLSAYNLFFSAERQRILKEIEAEETGGAFNAAAAEDEVEEGKDTCQALLRPLVPAEARRRPHRKTHGKIGFQTLAQMVGQRWKQLSVDQRRVYQDLADKDMIRHKDAMEAYYKKQGEDKEATAELEEKEKAEKKKAEKEKAEKYTEEKDDAKKDDDEEGKNKTEGEASPEKEEEDA